MEDSGEHLWQGGAAGTDIIAVLDVAKLLSLLIFELYLIIYLI
jgi:hypothetical protein